MRTLGRIVLCAIVAFTGSCATKGEKDAVFLLVVDTVRPDRLSCYGYDRHRTSNIDRIAGMGVRFDNAHAVASWTVPSMGSIMTSRFPTQLGLVEKPLEGQRTIKWNHRRQQYRYGLREEERTLAEILSDGGFDTGAFVNQPLLNPRKQFLQGFAASCYPTTDGEIVWVGVDNAWTPARFAESEEADPKLAAEFERWLSERRGEKVFAWVHLLSPHRPYRPPAAFMNGATTDDPSALYDGEIRAADAVVGNILDAIDRHVGLKRATIVFVSDHGEEFGEHDMEEHGHSLHREVVQVPLIIASPGLPAGRVVESFVRTIDILPTILDITGIDNPAGVEGVSLVSFADGTSLPLVGYAEGMLYGTTERSFLYGNDKLMYDEEGERYSLYDVENDPAEQNDLAARERERVSSLRSVLSNFHFGLLADFMKETQQPLEALEEEPDEETLKAMRSLGYIK